LQRSPFVPRLLHSYL